MAGVSGDPCRQTAIAINSTELVNNLAYTNYKLIKAYDDTIRGWTYALDLRDKYTEDHSERVAKMTISIAREMGISQQELVHARRGALLHDIGKMGVSDSILLKPGEITNAEWKKQLSFYRPLCNILMMQVVVFIPA